MATAKKTTFDVSKPGAPAITTSSTSRPIIIKHQTVQDPMVNDEAKKPVEPVKQEEAAPASVQPAKKIVIQPLHTTLDEPEAPAAEPVAAPVAEEPAREESAPPKSVATEPKVDDKPELPIEDKDQPVIDDEAKAAERSKRIKQLVNSQEYFLPIETIEQRRSKRTAIIGTLTILILLAAWYNVSLDAGLLPNTYNLPHTGFFGVK